MSPAFFRRLRKSDKRLVAAGAVLAFSLISLSTIMLERSTDEASRDIPVNNVDYAMVLQHYSGFDMSDTHTAIYLNWTNGVTELEKGETHLKLKARIYPINLENKTIKWASTNEKAAVIDEEGNITVIAPGEVSFTARLEETGKTAKAALTVIQPVTGLFLPTTNVKMYTGGSGTLLTAMVFPENATNTNIFWESNHPETVSVDSTGRIKPMRTGNAVITARTEDGDYERVCHVTVSEPVIEVNEINIQNKENAFVKTGETLQLTAVPKPSNAKNRTPLKWESSDEMIASVSQSGRVRGQSAGTAVISVSSTNEITDTIEVTVSQSDVKNALDLSDVYIDGAQTADAQSEVIYSTYSITMPMMVKLQMGLNPAPKIWSGGGMRSATEAETAEYMNPNQFYTGAYKYQFLDLSKANGVSAEIIDDFLADKGILSGYGQTFADVAGEIGVSEVYLAAHACLESGNGTSQLASGVLYNGVRVYNVFGIGAYDDSAVESGSKRAYELGWTSVEEAIRGGAQWISEHYINNPDGAQNTLYKMLWNPDNPGEHQYATDIGWAVKQAANIERIFNEFPSAALSYDIPVYGGMIPPVLE